MFLLRSRPQLEQESLLLPTDSLATMILEAMPCLADWDCSTQDTNLGMAITLPPAPVCIAVSGHWMLPPVSPSTIFVDRVDGLIWVVLLQKMHLLSESRLRSSLQEFKSLNCVHTDAVGWIWPYYIVDTNKSLLTGGWYSCLLRGSISAWQIQKWVLTVIHWTVHRVPNERAREITQRPDGVYSPRVGTTIGTNQYP